MKYNPLRQLERRGQFIWLDHIRRHLIVSGELGRLIEKDGLTAPDLRTNQRAEEAAQIERAGVIAQLLAQLDDRERQIIRYRYGLDTGHAPMTLKEVGNELNVSKERIRHLSRAIAKLRLAAVEQGLDVSENNPACEPNA